MKVIHLCCVAPPETGGMGRVADIEVKMLNARGVEAWLMAPEAGKPMVGPEYVSRVPAIGLGNAARILALDKILEDADVVHLHYPFYGTAGRVAALRRQGKVKRLVMTLHMDADAKGLRGLYFNVHRRLCQPSILAAADALTVSSVDYAEHSSYASLVHKRDTRLVEMPFGVDVQAFSPGPRQPEMFGIPAGARLVGTLSVMDEAHPFKGVDVLLHAVADLPPDVHVLLVGEGNRRRVYEKMAKDLGLAERAHFTGSLDDGALVAALRTMQVFAFPSTSRAEAFGLAMLEAMSCGVPVVASDLPGVRSVAKSAGLVVPVGEQQALAVALKRLLDDDHERQSLSSAARAKALQYSWERHIDKLVGVYEKLCA